MKRLTFIFVILIFISCTHNKKESNTINKTLGRELIKNDFLAYADSTKIDSLKTQITTSFYIYNKYIYKLVHVDAEELSEFNFDFFMPQLNKILSKRNLQITVKIATDYESSNNISINGKLTNLYTNKELKSGTFWDTAPRNFFKKINTFLREKNSTEQFYLLYSGNDLHAILLTKKQFKIIAERYKKEKNEIPYLP